MARPGKGLAHELVEALGGRLRGGVIKPGDKLPTESEIMQAFGVSRGVVREALSRLGAAGLVQTLHGVGTFALEPDRGSPLRLESPSGGGLADMLDVLELRASLESDAAGLAATRRSDAQLREMRTALDDFERHLAAVGETVAPDFRFHLAIALATGNRYYGDVMGQLGVAVIPRTRVASAWLDVEQRGRHLQKVNLEHLDIYAAIERRDAEAARAAMRVHLVNSRERQRLAHAEAVAGQRGADRSA
ncbi:MAG: FadR family transcriptional regulator [Proteobacteria bacterium]|nr:FadR family transcriptional regulator [Pseudomonadota bacterium]